MKGIVSSFQVCWLRLRTMLPWKRNNLHMSRWIVKGYIVKIIYVHQAGIEIIFTFQLGNMDVESKEI